MVIIELPWYQLCLVVVAARGVDVQSLIDLAIPVFAPDAGSGEGFPANRWLQAHPGRFRWHFCLSRNPNSVCLVDLVCPCVPMMSDWSWALYYHIAACGTRSCGDTHPSTVNNGHTHSALRIRAALRHNDSPKQTRGKNNIHCGHLQWRQKQSRKRLPSSIAKGIGHGEPPRMHGFGSVWLSR